MVAYQKYLAYNMVLSEREKNEKNVRQLKDYVAKAIV